MRLNEISIAMVVLMLVGVMWLLIGLMLHKRTETRDRFTRYVLHWFIKHVTDKHIEFTELVYDALAKFLIVGGLLFIAVGFM